MLTRVHIAVSASVRRAAPPPPPPPPPTRGGQILALSAAQTELCGRFGDGTKCAIPGAGSKVEMTGEIEFTGYTQGSYDMTVTQYTEGTATNCSAAEKYIEVSSTGGFVQMGDSNVFSGAVQVAFYSKGFAVTPATQAAAEWLQGNCSCSQTWEAGKMILLTTCAPPCDTTFLGGDDNPSSTGLALNGLPFYANVDLNAANKALYLSPFTSDWSQMNVNQ